MSISERVQSLYPLLYFKGEGRVRVSEGRLAQNPWYARGNALTLTLSLKNKGRGYKISLLCLNS
jgi:hypothetical protein